jgi:hypothetical protein
MSALVTNEAPGERSPGESSTAHPLPYKRAQRSKTSQIEYGHALISVLGSKAVYQVLPRTFAPAAT